MVDNIAASSIISMVNHAHGRADGTSLLAGKLVGASIGVMVNVRVREGE